MRQVLTLGVLLMVPLFFLWGCDNDTSNGDVGGGPEVKDGTCIGCHSSEEMLQNALAAVTGSKVPVPDKGDG